MVAEITYVHTLSGFVYTAFVTGVGVIPEQVLAQKVVGDNRFPNQRWTVVTEPRS